VILAIVLTADLAVKARVATAQAMHAGAGTDRQDHEVSAG
jgi:hypothetical protein